MALSYWIDFTCKYCGKKFTIVSRYHPHSTRFPVRAYCSQVCEDSDKKKSQLELKKLP